MTCWLCGENTSVERLICKNSPCQICRSIAKVNEEIIEAETTLRRLIAQRRDLRSEQNRVHDPIHRLPIELRNYIFELLLPRRGEWGELIPANNIVMPTYFTSICRGWRNIAWSNPSLWSTMHIVMGGRVSICSRINFVRDWILRSQTSPLTLHVAVKYRGCSEGELKVVLDVISQCSDRCHSLSLNIPPPLLLAFHHSNFQFHHLRRLRISTFPGVVNQPVSLLNQSVSLEKLEIRGVSLQSLQISWNHLTSATVVDYNFAEIVPLFQHASRMTYCQISFTRFYGGNFSITHQNLKVLGLLWTGSSGGVTAILGCLTLPSLQEFHTNTLAFLNPACLPALVHRSSCPLTGITLCRHMDESGCLDFQPFPEVTDLVLEHINAHGTIVKLLLKGYLPDLVHLTLRLQPFQFLWEMGNIPWLLDRKSWRPDSDVQNEGGLCKLLVVDERRASQIDEMWNSDVGKQLKELGFGLRKDGFEFLRHQPSTTLHR